MTPRYSLLRSATLSPAAFLFGLGVRARNAWYDAVVNPRRAPVPVISVGNLTLGGTGKTPMVQWLAQRLLEMDRRPAVVSRGYRGKAGRGPCVVSRGRGPEVAADVAGDEPFLLASVLHGVPVVVGSERWAAAECAYSLGADVIILDDGYQHRRLARDLDLLLLDAHSPFGNQRLIPAGTLREPVSSVARADAVVITRSRPGERFPVVERVIRRHNPRAPILRAGHRSTGFVDPRGRPAPQPARVLAFCAIGNPENFRADLDSADLDVVGFVAFRDHHAYRESEIRQLARRADSLRATLLTTEKDLVRIPPSALDGGPSLVAVRIEPVVHDAEALLGMVRSAIDRRAT